jgi:protein-S-isoprenylcysteine O-methyltransferase Ste14
MTESTERGARVRVPPPLVFLAAMVVGWFLPGLRFHGRHGARIAIGAVLLAGGVSLVAAAFGLFRKTGQNPRPWTPTPELIFAGPYQYTRNPMYLGMTLLTLGVSALFGHVFIALLAPVALAIVHFTAVLPEEEYLAQKFGEPYAAYKVKVRRYF